MTYYHELWDPPLSQQTVPLAQREIQVAQNCLGCSAREWQYVSAIALIFVR